MKATFDLVRPACDFKGVISESAAVSVVAKRMQAFNKHLQISVPCDLPDFSVAAQDFDFALRKIPSAEPVLKVTDANVTVSGGGTTRVSRLPNPQPLKKPDIATVPFADLDDLLSAIDDVFPFTVGDPARPWSEGARFDGNKITATNSVMLIQAELVSSSGFDGVTVSRVALEYMRQRRADLKAWGVSERGILLEFNDGGWALASRMAMEMPNQAVSLINMVNDWEDFQDVDDACRGAFLRIGDWTDKLITVYSDRLFAGKNSSEHDEPVSINLSEGVESALFAKDIISVLQSADKIAFDRYPTPVPFVTKRGSRGLIAGKTS